MNNQQLISEIKLSLNGFIETFAKLNEKEINISPGNGTWTAGELGQHVVLATTRGVSRTKPVDRPYDKLVGEIKQTFLDFNSKFVAPSFLVPEHRSYGKEEILKALRQNMETQIRAAQTDDLTRINLEIELPGWGCLTDYEWMTVMIYHVQRHTEQLRKYVEA